MIVPYGIGTYRRADLPQIKLVNFYVEQVPDKQTGLTLLPRPALAPLVTLPTGPVRALFSEPGVLGGGLLAVAGQRAYLNGSDVGATPGTSPVVIAGTLTGALLANGSGLYVTTGGAVSQIAFPDGAGVSWAGFLGGYAFALRTDSRRIYFTLDPSTWDGLDYVAAEQSTGNTVGAAIVGDQIWVFSERSTEIFVLTGNPDTPIQSVQGRVFDKGALSRDSIAVFDNTVVWVGHDRIVYRGAGAPTRISQHGIEERLAGVPAPEVTAWTYPWAGHTFYALTIADETVIYDAATREWHQVASLGLGRWRAQCGAFDGADVIAGDALSGTLWKLRDGVYADGADQIEGIFTVLVNERGFLDNLTLDCSTGEPGDPNLPGGVIELRTSRDDGKTYGNWRSSELGREGKYRQRVVYRRLGMVDQAGMVCELRVTDDRPRRVSEVKVNEALSGRSR